LIKIDDGDWTFLTNHPRVLLCIAVTRVRLRDIAASLRGSRIPPPVLTWASTQPAGIR